MSVAVVSLLALLVIIVISCVVPKLNPGLLSIFAALVIGVYVSDFSVNSVLALFPSSLFILLVSMTLVFGVALANGTLEKVTQRAVFLIKGQELLLPLLVFFLAFVFSALGPGNIAAVAVLAPVAMVLAAQHKISPLLIAIMLCTGANAGAFSPFSPTGVVAFGLLQQISVDTSLIWVVFGASAVLQAVSAFVAYGIFLLRAKRRKNGTVVENLTKKAVITVEPLEKKQKLTLLCISVLISGVILFQVPLTLMAVSVAVLLFVLNLGSLDNIVKILPWETILMVTGIAILIGLLEETGGLDLATSIIASVTSAESISAVLAFVSGLVSAYSSSSGVVLPAFVPLIPGLAEKMAVTNIIPMVIAVAVGSHMVDVSPLSTLGALSIAAVEEKTVRDRMFKWLMIWGLGMAVVAGILAFIFLDLML